MIKYLALAAAFGATLAAGAAQAASPWQPSVVGAWSANADQHSLTITIASEGSTGNCRQITGTILDNSIGGTPDTLLGFYCPVSGQVAFARFTAGATSAYQNYTAGLSQKGKYTYMGGVFSENATPANVGEYGFYAVIRK